MQRRARSVPIEFVLRAALAVLVAVGHAACESGGSNEGGETHWLRTCEASSDCDVGSCHCGVCTSPCSTSDECAVFGVDAMCATAGSGGFAEYCGDRTVPSGICVRRPEAGSPRTDAGSGGNAATGSGGNAGTGSGGNAGTGSGGNAGTGSGGGRDAGANGSPDSSREAGALRDALVDTVSDVSVDRGSVGTGGTDAGANGSGGNDAGANGGGGGNGGTVDGGGVGEGAVACAPIPGDWHVDPTGSDTSGNGSSGCPFKTLTHAVAAVAAQSPAIANTITLHHSGTAPSTYGAGCSGGPPCDATPIVLPYDTSTQPLVIQGDGAASDVILTGASLVLNVYSFDVSLQHFTVNVVNNGIMFDYAMRGSISDAVVQGGTSAGSLIIANGSSEPRVGPGVQLIGGTMGITTLGASRASVTGTAAEPTVIRGATGYCVDVENGGINGAFRMVAGDPGGVVVRDCGGPAVMVNTPGPGAFFELVLITRVDGGAYDGIMLMDHTSATIHNSQIKNLMGDGVALRGSAFLQVLGGVISGNSGDGIDCSENASLRLGSANLNANGGNGLYVHGACRYDAMAFQEGVHVFNTTTAKNGLSGLCYLSSAQTLVGAGNAEFSCEYAGPLPCVSVGPPNPTPTTATATTCAADRDMTLAPGVTVDLTEARCCN